MRKLLVISMLLLFAVVAHAQDSATMQAKLNFLEGDWISVSTFPATGQEVTGDLSYHWTIGGNWLLCRFIGDHPTREYWEAVAMMRWDTEAGHYVSLAFFGPSDPGKSEGILIDGKIISMRNGEGNDMTGIDYHPTATGVYQENWRFDEEGKRVITLKTVYTKAK
jgi:hypothetical protein